MDNVVRRNARNLRSMIWLCTAGMALVWLSSEAKKLLCAFSVVHFHTRTSITVTERGAFVQRVPRTVTSARRRLLSRLMSSV